MCGTIGNDSGVTIGKTSPGGGSGPSIAQNNITKVVDLGYYQQNTTDFQDKLDALNLTVLEIDTPVYFKAITKLENGLLIKQLFEFTPGKGVYNPVGATTTIDDLLIIEETYPNLEDIEPILLDGTLIEIGEISINLIDYINSQSEVDFSDPDTIYYLKYTLDGIEYIYQYTGVPQFYGTDYPSTAVVTDFDLLYTSGNTNTVGIVPSFQDTLNVSEVGNKMKLVKDNSFLFNQFNLNTNGTLFFNDKIIVFGSFTAYGATPSGRLIILNSNGTVYRAFGVGFNGEVTQVKFSETGKLICVGAFTSYQGTAANRIICLNIDGTIDTSFVYGTGFNSGVNDFDFDSLGNILAVGQFTLYNGTAANRVIKLTPTGSIEVTFVYGTGFNGVVNSIVIDKTIDIAYIVGNLTDYNGTYQPRISSLNANGTINVGFNPGAGVFAEIKVIKLYNNQLYIGGSFIDYDGVNSNNLARIERNGDYDYTFLVDTGFNFGVIYSIGFDGNKVIVGGEFTTYQGTAALRIARLNADATLDDSFFIGSGVSNTVNGIFLSPTGQYYINGSFDNIQGNAISYFGILNNTGYFSSNASVLKFSFNNENNGIAEYYSDLYSNITNYELINKKILEERLLSIPSNFEKIVASKCNGIYGTHTGNLAETVLLSIPIQGDEFKIGDWGTFGALPYRISGTAAASSIRVRAGINRNTSDDLIAFYTINTGNKDNYFERIRFRFKTGNILSGYKNNVSAQTDVGANSDNSEAIVNPANLWYLTFTIVLTNIDNVINLEGYIITKINQK